MEYLFPIEKRELSNLNAHQAVDLFRELLLSEATVLGIGKNLIDVPSAINVADGGIDAQVKNVEFSGGQGIIKEGLTRYQIKTGDFSPSREGNIKNILFKEGTNELKPKIKSCLDQKGTLVIVLFGYDSPDSEDEQTINRFRQKLLEVNKDYSDAEIEIWKQNQIIGFLRPYISLRLDLKGIRGQKFQTLRSWSENQDMKKAFVQSEDYNEKVNVLRDLLGNRDRAIHIRIIGETGFGKTRFVLESLRCDDLAPLVLYMNAHALETGPLITDLCMDDNQNHVIIVADECNEQQSRNIWNLLATRGPRIAVVSIYNESEISEYGIDYIKIPRLSTKEIGEIIQSYGVNESEVRRWAELAGSSPRFAHMIGTNLKLYPDEVLRPVEGIYDRIIAGYDDPSSEEVRRRKKVLMHLALFKRFGYEHPFQNEARVIASIVEKSDPNITWALFQEIIGKLKDQFILQGETSLYITPPALHIYMFVKWWDTFGHEFDLDEFLKDVPEDSKLREWFDEMIKYARLSPIALDVVRKLLNSGKSY